MRFRTFIQSNEEFEGESIEFQIRRSTSAKEPIETISPIIYTPRSAGVCPEYDIRTDKWEIARKAMDMVGKSYLAKRDNHPNRNGNSEETSGHAGGSESSTGN